MARTILIGLIAGFAAICFALPKPPEGAVKRIHGKTTCYSGVVYLSAPDDTLKLKILGFRSFVFDSRTFGSLKYKAEWPDSVLNLPLPNYVNGMDYDVAEQAGSDGEATDTVTHARSRSIRPRDVHPTSMWMDTAWAHRFLAQLDVRVRSTRYPDNTRPDTVIAGREYTHGVIVFASVADTASLVPLGFFGFERSEAVYDSSEDGASPVVRQSSRAYWPKDISAVDLPGSVYSIQSDRAHLGEGVVRMKARELAK